MVSMTRFLVRRPGRLVADRRHDDGQFSPSACVLIAVAAVVVLWLLIIGVMKAVAG